MTKSKRRRWRHESGTASVEVVVMLPMFIVLLSAVYYCYGRAAAKLEALTAARGCAFQYAMNGCDTADEGVDLCAAAQGEKLARVKGGEFTGVFSLVEKVPFVGSAVETLFGEGARGKAVRSSARFTDGEREEHEQTVYLVCNTRSRTMFGHIKDSFCDFAQAVAELGGGDSVRVPGCGT